MRMTKACLQGKVRTINTLLGFEAEPAYDTQGSVVLYGAYGGHGVHRYSGGHGGVSDLMGGCQTARECARFLDGMIAALYAAEEG